MKRREMLLSCFAFPFLGKQCELEAVEKPVRIVCTKPIGSPFGYVPAPLGSVPCGIHPPFSLTYIRRHDAKNRIV